MPDLDVNTADGTTRVFTLLHDARPVLLNLGEPGGSTCRSPRSCRFATVVLLRRPRRSPIMVRNRPERSARGVRSGQGGSNASDRHQCEPSVADIAAARDFYTDYLGLSVEEFNLEWVARYRLPSGQASVQLVTRNATAPHDSVISVHVGASVDEAYAEAKRRGYEIVHPLTEQAWGVRRFFVRAPDGNVIKMVSHSDE
jgi:catechol 2,3-dioxygenase-like lactoylglutathione lyase family enzyme